MTEDIVKRLRKRQEFEFIDSHKRVEWEDEDALAAADHIEELNQLMRIRTWRYESCCRDKVAADARIEALEKALIWIIENDYNLNLTIDAKKKVAIDALKKDKDDQ